MTKNRQNKKNDLLLLAGVISILLLINIINRSYFFRFDLTSEKRYTLSDDTKNILKNLDDIIFIKVYLEGDLNISFSKFQKSINDLLEEFKVYGKSMIQYEFENPFEDATSEMQNKIIQELYGKGLKPTNIHQRDNEGGVSEKIIFPAAVINYKGVEIPLNLLLNNPGQNAEQNLINSQEGLEFSLISTIRNITDTTLQKIAFVEGHGELSELEVNDISSELAKSYQIDRGAIIGRPGILDKYEAIVIANPTLSFNEQDKFVIDQYIMQGGKVLWLIDAVQVSLDSLINGETLAFIRELNLEDLLFKYGVRINPELVQDVQCNVIPINVALTGNNPNFQPAPWLYNALLIPNSQHPVSQNLNLLLSRFANPIDTIAARKNIKKTVLLATSPHSKTKKVPALVSLEEIKETSNKEEFTESNLIVGALLEGEFESAFINRGIDSYFSVPLEVKEKSISTKMAIIADGDIIKNDVTYSEQGPSVIPLGYDRYTRQTFGNKELLVNLIHYLAKDENLLSLRGREFKLRLLDTEKIKADRNMWILLNMLVPSLLVLLCGVFYMKFRNKRYSN